METACCNFSSFLQKKFFLFSKYLSVFLFFLLLTIFQSSNAYTAVIPPPQCGCGDKDKICEPALGDSINCAGTLQDCEGKPTCETDACNPNPDGCCPGVSDPVKNPNKLAKCQGVIFGLPDYDPDCRSQCFPTICENGLFDEVGETCEFEPQTNKEIFKPGSGTLCPAGSCRHQGMTGACTCCGDGNIDNGPNGPEECDPNAPADQNKETCGTKYPGKISFCTLECSCAFCGNGKKDPGEQCDGFNKDCQINGQDGKCGEQCNCIPFCGNGKIDSDKGETCDINQNPQQFPDCRNDCHFCGDKTKDPTEQCDKKDPNNFNPPGPTPPQGCQLGQYCDDNCGCVTPPPPVCGNGKREGNETCDIDPNTGTKDLGSCGNVGAGPCRPKGDLSGAECSCCGDGAQQGDEKCDRGVLNVPLPNTTPGVCRTDCGFCGDKIVQAGSGEECEVFGTPCDTPNGPGTCGSTCNCIAIPPKCGDNRFDPNETCEFDPANGNKVSSLDPNNTCSDAAPNACRPFGTPFACSCCGDGKAQLVAMGGTETCDQGAANKPIGDMSGDCRVDCGACLDGVKQASEECEVATDCGDPTRFTCTGCKCVAVPPKCGDGVFNQGQETCEFDPANRGNVFSIPGAACLKAGPAACRSVGADACSCCGDGKVQGNANETCDNAAGNSQIPNDLSGDCRAADCTRCGDLIRQPQDGEDCETTAECNDANKICDGCKCIAKPIKCGDGILDSGESCDTTPPPGNLGVCGTNTCRDPNDAEKCTCCGDKIKQPSEKCDDPAGNSNNPNDITGKCRAIDCTSCGDGELQTNRGEQCEKDGDCNNPLLVCDKANCQCIPKTAMCGDGIKDPNESCDTLPPPGPSDPGICGTNACRSPNDQNACSCCGDKILQRPSETCDDPKGNSSTPNDLTGACRAADCTRCGDGVWQMQDGEQCDTDPDCKDPNKVCNGCKCVQKPAKCGDGILDQDESCDTTNPGVCGTNTCRDPNDLEKCTCCGDGVRQGSEKCDDPKGNSSIPNDVTGACRAGTCTYCGDLVVQMLEGEQCEIDSQCGLGQGCVGCQCKPLCGNGKKDPGELCDKQGESCKTVTGQDGTCDNQCGCTAFCGDGTVNNNEECDFVASTTCTTANGQNGTCDNQCKCNALCGNGQKDPGELCDGEGKDCQIGNQAGTCGKNCDCILNCGNGTKDNGEECDPKQMATCTGPNNEPGNCDNQCKCILIPPRCGDNIFNPGETCEFDQNGTVKSKSATDICSGSGLNVCRSPGSNFECGCCGDGVPQGMPGNGESCDNGANNKPLGDMTGACRVDCGLCHDGVVQSGAGEECETAAHCPAGNGCVNCKCQPLCGNGTLDPNEQCDINGVACSNPNETCQNCQCVQKTPSCGDGRVEAPEQSEGTGVCTLPNGQSGTCNGSCQCIASPLCGDGKVEGTEQCEGTGVCTLPNGQSGTCNGSCQCIASPLCGDGKVEGTEQCEGTGVCTLPNGQSGTCNGSCQCIASPVCGDGKVEGTEQCDKNVPCSNQNQICNEQTCQCEAKPVEPAKCGNNKYEPVSGETCDGTAAGVCGTNACRPSKDTDPSQQAPCSCCGDSNTDLLAGEECDNGPMNGPNGTCDANCKRVIPQTPSCGNSLIDGTETCDGATRAKINLNGIPQNIICQQECRGPNGQNACSCCGDMTVDRTSEDCDPPNGTTCDKNCKTISTSTPPGPGAENPPPTGGGTPAETPPQEYCVLEGSGGCSSKSSNQAPSNCIISVIEPSIWQTMNPFTFAQWMGSLLVPGMLFGVVRFRKQKK